MYVDWQLIGGICLSGRPIGPVGGASWGVGVLVASLITVDGVEVTFFKTIINGISKLLKTDDSDRWSCWKCQQCKIHINHNKKNNDDDVDDKF